MNHHGADGWLHDGPGGMFGCEHYREITETEVIEVDPAELLPGDVVISLSYHEISGCHCDVRVWIEREMK